VLFLACAVVAWVDSLAGGILLCFDGLIALVFFGFGPFWILAMALPAVVAGALLVGAVRLGGANSSARSAGRSQAASQNDESPNPH